MTEVSGSRDRRRLDWLVSGRQADFHAADRHTARVRRLRRFIVVGSLLAIVCLTAIPIFDPFRRLPAALSVSSVGLNGTKVTMELPKMSGFRQDGRPYEVRARQGIQDIKTPSIFELVGVDADVGMADTSKARITSDAGVYNSADDKVSLTGNVRIKKNASYDMRMKSARMDLKAGELVTEEPVEVILDNGTIAADRMTMTDSGRVISFEGAVHSVMELDDKPAPAQPGALTEAAK